MGIYIPNMDKPSKCTHCIMFRLEEAPTHYAYDEVPYVYPYCVQLEREIECEEIPTDCQMIEIVTCKECKYRNKNRHCDGGGADANIAVSDDHFCSYGERRNDDI